jgi:hypothetical protein
MVTRGRTRKRPRAEPGPDPIDLSRLLLQLHGVLTLGRVRNTPALPLDLVGVDLQGRPVLAAVLSGAAPAERLDLMVRLLGDGELAGMVRLGCRLLVLCWGANAAGTRTVEVVRVTAEDYGPAGGSGGP